MPHNHCPKKRPCCDRFDCVAHLRHELDRRSEYRNHLFETSDTRTRGVLRQIDDLAPKCGYIDHNELMQRKLDFLNQRYLREKSLPRRKCSCREHKIKHIGALIDALNEELDDLEIFQKDVTRLEIKVNRARAARDPGYVFIERPFHTRSDIRLIITAFQTQTQVRVS